MTYNLNLRAVEPSDLDFLYMLESAEGCADASLNSAPVSRQLLWEYIQSYTADIFAAGQLRLIIEADEDGQKHRVGTIDISDFEPLNRRGFAGIIIAPEYRRHGYARAALTQLCDYASTTLGMHQLAAVVAVDNAPSIALFKSCGFKSTGRLRSWIRRGRTYTDALIFQRLF